MSAPLPLLPAGFQAASVHCGIKKPGLPDLSLFVSDRPATTARR
jgi:N-acetylglutamate synthase/N-acetylornithine aminotransferase